MEACAYERPRSGRDGVPAALRSSLEIKGLFASTRDRPLVLREQKIGPINFSTEGRAGFRSAPCTHGYPVHAGRGKRSVLSRVPTHFRPESPRSRRKTLCFQCGGCPGHAQICPRTANSGLAGVEAMATLAKGQVRSVPGDDMPAQRAFVHQIFGLAA